jgi:ADP-heptose:LPS heptosyltransferase
MIAPTFRPRRIVILRLRGLGDVVLSSAVIDALTRAYPDADLDYLSASSSRELLEPDSRLSRIFLLAYGRPESGRVQTGRIFRALSWMRKGKADLVVDLFSNPLTAILTAASGARYRVGLDKRLRRFAYNLRVPRFLGPPAADHRYARDVQLDFLRGVGIEWEGEARASISLKSEEVGFAERSLGALGYARGKRFGAVIPGGSWESKRWSVEGFVEVARELAEEFGEPTLVVWGPPEEEDARSIVAGLGPSGRLAPPTTLRQMAALLGRPALTLSTDCLGRHFSIVQGVATVGVFGTTDPRDWTPVDGPHRAVRAAPGTSLRDLPAGPVVAEIRHLLRDGRLDSSQSEA